MLAAAPLLLAALPARADFAGAVGGDYYSGPSGQVTKSVLGVASVGVAGGFATIAGLRFDDSLVGPGFGVTAGAGAPLGSPTRLVRALATRYVGDGAYRAWRVKAGPFLQWGGTSLGLSFVRYVDNEGGEATGGLAEVETPVASRWRATFDGSAAEIQGGEQSLSGSAGIAWTASPRITLSASLGVARNGSIVSAQPAATSRGLTSQPILGSVLGGGGNQGRGDASAASPANVSATVLFGIRVPIP